MCFLFVCAKCDKNDLTFVFISYRILINSSNKIVIKLAKARLITIFLNSFNKILYEMKTHVRSYTSYFMMIDYCNKFIASLTGLGEMSYVHIIVGGISRKLTCLHRLWTDHDCYS